MRLRLLLAAALLAPIAHPVRLAAQSTDGAAVDTAVWSRDALLDAPADPIAYHTTRERVTALLAAGSHADAESDAEWLAREYPRDARNWHLLARTKAALQKHAEAAAAYRRVGELMGWRSPYVYPGVMAAASLLASGDRAGALAELRRELEERRNFYIRSAVFAWPGLQELQGDSSFLRIVGRPPTAGLSRDEGWRRDVDFLVEEVRRVNPDYHDAPLPAEFVRRHAALRAEVPRLTDEQIFVRMGAMLGTLRQGHLNVFPPQGAGQLPVQPYLFPEGVYLVSAREGHERLAGARLIAVNGIPVDTLLRRLAAHRSVGADMQHAWGTADLASAWHLRGIGALPAGDSVDVTVQLRGAGAPEVVRLPVTARPPARRPDKLVAPPGVAAPLFLRESEQSHWDVPLPDHDAHYVQLNQVRPDPDETLAQFGVRLRATLAERTPTYLILDLRHNNGGATGLYPELLRTVIAFSTRADARVYALVGRRVFSATANFVTDLERLVRPVFVGEPTSACCSFTGDPSHATLPHSRLGAELTSVRWNLGADVYDGRRELVPDVPVQLTADAYFAGRDPVLETTLRLIAIDRSRPRR